MKKHQFRNDENLPNINKTKHQKKGDRKVQDARLKSKQKKTPMRINCKGNNNKSIIQTFPNHEEYIRQGEGRNI